MSSTVNIHEAKTHLSRLVEKGETDIGPKDGKRRLGGLEGLISVPDDFDTMMAQEIEEMFYDEQHG
jgi:hypothetical protein